MFGLSSKAPEVRASILGHYRSNPASYQPFGVGEAYCARMSVNRTWGSHIEVAAAEALYNVRVL